MSSEPQEKLSPLPKKLDGYSEEVTLELHRCDHSKDKLQIISSTEVRCSCGAGWSGPMAYKLAS